MPIKEHFSKTTTMAYFKIYFFVLLFFSFQLYSNAQVGTTAANFTAIDSHGESHTLYDYLDAGKIVVLDFYYTTCGPCQFYSPQVNLAYEKYGCNNANVIFMGIDWADTDSEVIAYDEEYQIEYPSISGVDGGGNAIVTLYNISGFPTFYVIDSTKTIIDQIDPPTLQVFDFRFEMHGIIPADCNATAVSDAQINNQLHVFPNPVDHGNLTINLPETLNGNAELEIIDLYGKIVDKAQINLSKRSHQVSINQLNSGIYIVKIKALNSGQNYLSLFVKI